MDAAPPESPPAGPRGLGLTEPLLRYLEARGVLLSIEAQEALQKIMGVMIFAAVAMAAAFMAWLLLTAVLLSLIMKATGWHWVTAAAVLGGAHLAVALGFLQVVRSRLGGLSFFGDTLNEFRKDRAWLASQNRKS